MPAIDLRPGVRYRGTALLKQTHTEKDIRAKLASFDVTLESWIDGESGKPGYRRVTFVAVAGPNARGSFPMSLPAPLSWIDKSRIEEIGAGRTVDTGKLARSTADAIGELRAYAESLSPQERLVSGIGQRLAHAEEAAASGDFGRAAAHMTAVADMIADRQASVGAGAFLVEEVGFASYMDAIVAQQLVAQQPEPQPPHRCTAASAQAIARQIAPEWTYSYSLPANADVGTVETRQHDVVTPSGPKRIEARFRRIRTRAAVTVELLLTCPYTGEIFAFTPSARQGTHVGAAGQADFNALMQSDPHFASAWNRVQAQLQSEGFAGEITAVQGGMADAFNKVSQVSPELASSASKMADAAAQLTIGVFSVAGAVGQVASLVNKASGVKTDAQAINMVMGTLIVVTTAINPGIGAALAVGAAIVEGLFESPPQPSARVCGADVSPPPACVVGCVLTDSCTEHKRIGDPNSPAWRHFPETSNADDAPWFTASANVAIFNWPSDPLSVANWRTLWGGGSFSFRPIDLAFSDHKELEALATDYAASIEAAGRQAEADLLRAYFQAWKANKAFLLNGNNPPTSDWQVLVHVIRLWNAAHEPGNGFTWNDDNDATYLDGVIGDAIRNGSSLLDVTGGVIHIHDGPRKLAVPVKLGDAAWVRAFRAALDSAVTPRGPFDVAAQLRRFILQASPVWSMNWDSGLDTAAARLAAGAKDAASAKWLRDFRRALDEVADSLKGTQAYAMNWDAGLDAAAATLTPHAPHAPHKLPVAAKVAIGVGAAAAAVAGGIGVYALATGVPYTTAASRVWTSVKSGPTRAYRWAVGESPMRLNTSAAASSNRT